MSLKVGHCVSSDVNAISSVQANHEGFLPKMPFAAQSSCPSSGYNVGCGSQETDSRDFTERQRDTQPGGFKEQASIVYTKDGSGAFRIEMARESVTG